MERATRTIYLIIEGETICLFDGSLGLVTRRSIKINGERRVLEVKMGEGGFT